MKDFPDKDKKRWTNGSLARMTAVYSFSHFAVDLSCIFLIVGVMMPQLATKEEWLLCVMLYNMFAFAFQMPTGALADMTGRHAMISAAGCGLVFLAYGVDLLPSCLAVHIMTAVTAGLGNSCFHVGGGIDILHAGRGRAGLPGIFVSTGAFGIYLGGRLYKTGLSTITCVKALVIVALLVSALLIVNMYIRHGFMDWPAGHDKGAGRGSAEAMQGGPAGRRGAGSPGIPAAAAACLLFTICVRSYAGTLVSYDWQAAFVPGLLFSLGIVLGKAGGGLVGDRAGWRLTGTLSLCISAFCFIGGRTIPALGILGIFLFNMTMPLTLTALADMMPGHTGTAFGMTTFALFTGILPSFFGDDGRLFAPLPMTVMVLVSAGVFFAGMTACQEQGIWTGGKQSGSVAGPYGKDGTGTGAKADKKRKADNTSPSSEEEG